MLSCNMGESTEIRGYIKCSTGLDMIQSSYLMNCMIYGPKCVFVRLILYAIVNVKFWEQTVRITLSRPPTFKMTRVIKHYFQV